MDRLESKKRMLDELMDWAAGSQAEDLKREYAPKAPEAPATDAAEAPVEAAPVEPTEEDVEAVLAQMDPAQLQSLLGGE